MDKVFIIQGSSGSWDEKHEWLESAYLDENKALEEVIKLNDDLKRRKEINSHNRMMCNDINVDCDSNCDECEYETDYNLDEQHNYSIVECELK